jgi:zinc transport system substrate-binding protein
MCRAPLFSSPMRTRAASYLCCCMLAGLVMLAAMEAMAQPRVVVTSKPAHSIVAAVMEGVGSPRVLIEGSQSAHTYAMKPSDARALTGADVFIRVSEELEPFTAKLLAVLPRSVLVVTLRDAPGLQLLESRRGTAFASHAHDDSVSHGSYDPHIWLDPENAKAMARHVAAALATRMPAHAAQLATNAERLSGRIDALHRELETTLRPLSGRPILVFHDAYQYLERRYGLRILGSLMVAPNVHGGARRVADLRAKVAQSGATCVFAEPHFEPKAATAVVEGLPAKFGTLDPEAALLSPGPQLYFSLMRGLADSLRRCLS